MREITYNGFGTKLWGLATSVIDNCLYIADNLGKCIHKVDLSVMTTVGVASWNVSGYPHGLSLTSAGNVLVVTWPNEVFEFTSNGTLIRQINETNYIWQALEVNDGMWVYSRQNPMNGI